MNWYFAYTPYIWPMLASAVLFLIFGIYAWQRRSISGALQFSIMLLFMLLWSLGATLELAAADFETKVFWFKFTSVMKLPAATAELCFGIQYSGLGHFLTRRKLMLLFTPPLLVLMLTLTNGIHHLIWLGFSFDGALHPLRSTLTYVIVGYSFLLALATFVVFIRLFLRSPQNRWPVTLILVEMLIARSAVLLEYSGKNPVAPMDPVVLIWNVGAILYAAALFGFRIFDEITVARQTVIAQMHEGMLVLDMQGRVASLNPAAQAILGASARRLLGRPILDLLPGYPAVTGELPAVGVKRIEINRGTGMETRYYMLETSELIDWGGLVIGRLLLLHDVTEQRLAHAKLLEQQRALATLQERERLARELHDSLGQVLGYVGFQVEAVSKLVADGQASTATAQLGRLAGIIHEAHADMREYILDLHSAPAPEQPFFTALRNYLAGFTHNYDIQTLLSLDERLDDETFPPDTRMQVFRHFAGSVVERAQTWSGT